ncbi:DEAD-box ATP-dependent RNA helicase 7 [Linum perenne]
MKSKKKSSKVSDHEEEQKLEKKAKKDKKKKRKAEEIESGEEDRNGTSSELGEEKKKKSKKVKKSKEEEECGELEEEAKVVDPNAVTNFRISEPLKQKLKSRGIEALFPIQAMTFNDVLDGCDLVGRARTGQVRISELILNCEVWRTITSQLLEFCEFVENSYISMTL